MSSRFVRLCVPRGRFVSSGLVVGAVAREGSERFVDPVEQGADLRGVVHVPGGQQRGDDAPGAGVHAEVQLAP